MSPRLLGLTCASLVVLAACADDPAPAPRKTVPHDVAPPHAPPSSTDGTPAIDRPEAAATVPPQPERTCAPGVTMSLGNTYPVLACLPHLDAINYWRAERAWAAYDAAPVTVAVLDLSFLVDHPDIAPAVDFTWNFLKEGCASVEPAKTSCRDVAPLVPEPPPAAAFGEEQIKLVHGTMLAGLIGGRGSPGSGIVGVNPSAALDLFVRDLDADNLKALRHAVERRVDVISMSWPLGSQYGEKDVPEFKELLETATQQGTVVVMAAGNSRIDVDQKPVFPTRYAELAGVIAVGSIDENGDLYAQFSNYGPSYVEIGAPGKGASSGGDFLQGRYSVQIGSSYSGPMVAGAVSRIVQYLKTKNVPYTAADIERHLTEGSPTSPKLTPYFKGGRHLDMAALLAHLDATIAR